MPSFCFGEISRAEINSVLNIAGVPLTPPKKVEYLVFDEKINFCFRHLLPLVFLQENVR